MRTKLSIFPTPAIFETFGSRGPELSFILEAAIPAVSEACRMNERTIADARTWRAIYVAVVERQPITQAELVNALEWLARQTPSRRGAWHEFEPERATSAARICANMEELRAMMTIHACRWFHARRHEMNIQSDPWWTLEFRQKWERVKNDGK